MRAGLNLNGNDLAAAIDRDDELDMILCQQSLDALPAAKKTQLWGRVRELEDSIRKGEIPVAKASASS